ncbi:TIGR00153 family protein [Candidatus Njordibacter sp. Uisw_056]|jgi:predicted phosphate transport protein (TIGR00153 family)|uniref:TIGR00153 family protein n=1 Tax=Candidatus Njordibacter sp. Uisw_056 TaxID=3230973 RepID=UPI003D502554|tara:strand:- start:6961 stop:7635 length:675 start_codon:yes stop_codon:yes gene_type:complete
MANPILSLFGHSPIKPLQNHMHTSLQCVELLIPFFQAVIKEDWGTVEATYNSIAKLEGDADNQKQDIRLHLPKSLFMPINRSDLIQLLSKQDKICNTAKDIAGIMLGRKQVVPKKIATDMTAYVKSAVAVAVEAKVVIDELDELIGSGFGGREIDRINRCITKLEKAEDKNDKRQITLRAKLHEIEADLPPVDAMFMYKTIETIGNLADRAQSAGEQIQVIIAR